MPGYNAYLVDAVQFPRFHNPHNQKINFEIGGAQYDILRDDVVTTPGKIRVYKSIDGGVTWAEQDSANAPVYASSAGIAQDGTLIRAAFQANATNILSLIAFDTVTDTWGPVTGGGPNLGAGGHGIYLGVRSTSDLVVYYDDISGTGETFYVIYSGGWGAPVQVSGTPGETAGTKVSNGIFVDSTDLIGFLYFPIVFAGNYTQYYRAMDAADTFGARSDLYTVPSSTSGPVTGRPEQFGTLLYIPYNRFIGAGPVWNPAVIIGNASANLVPVFTDELVNNVYPASNTGAIGGNGVTFVTVDGANVLVWWTTPYTPNLTNKLAVASSTGPGMGWSAATLIYDLQTDPNPGAAAQFIHDLSVTLLMSGAWMIETSMETGLNPATGFPYCSTFAVRLAPAPAPATVRIDTGTRRMVILVPNSFDLCLYDDIPLWRRVAIIAGESKCCLPDPRDYFHWEEMTKGADYFRKVGSIATPAPIDGDVLVTSFQVPLGYDGIIRAIFHRYTGPGFVDGSGDIIWRIRVNRAWAKHLGNILVQIGDITKPSPLEEGIPLTSGRYVEYFVNVPDLSGGILIGASRIVCGFEGWFFQRH